jgi:hypothetical protein
MRHKEGIGMTIKKFTKKHGFGVGTIEFDGEMYQGRCSTNESTAKYRDLSVCIQKMIDMGWILLP